MKNNTSDSRVRYFCKCPYCGFNNEVEVKKDWSLEYVAYVQKKLSIKNWSNKVLQQNRN